MLNPPGHELMMHTHPIVFFVTSSVTKISCNSSLYLNVYKINGFSRTSWWDHQLPANNPRPPVLFLSVVVPFGSVNQFCEVNPAPPWNTGPNVLSTSLVSPGLECCNTNGTILWVLELNDHHMLQDCLPVLSAKIFSPS